MIYKNGYTTKSAVDCFSSCLLSYLSYMGINFSLEDAFLCGGGLKLSFNPNNNNYLIAEDSITDIYIKAMSFYEVPICFGHCQEEQKRFLIEHISKEYMIMLRLSTSNLTYHNIFQQNAEMGHFINIIGYEKNSDMVLISDGYVPSRIISTYDGWMDINELIEIWRKKEFAYAVLEFNKNKLPLIKEKIEYYNNEEVIYAELKQYIEGKFCEDKQLYTGCKAIEAFAENLIKLCDYSPNEIAEKTYKMVYNIKILGLSIGKNCILKVLQNNELFKIYAWDYQNIIKRWNIILLHILKIKYYHSKDYINSVIKDILDINKREIKLLRKIINNYKKSAV